MSDSSLHLASHSPLSGEHGAAEIKKLLQQPLFLSQIRMTNNSLSRPLYFGSAIFKGLRLVKSDGGKYHFSGSGNKLRKLVASDESINPHQPVPRAVEQQRSPGSEQQPTFSRSWTMCTGTLGTFREWVPIQPPVQNPGMTTLPARETPQTAKP